MKELMSYFDSTLETHASKITVSLEYNYLLPFIYCNDFLVAKVFLSSKPVLTVQITNLIDPLGSNWNILTGTAFLSFIVPMAVFFGFQKYFARGLLSGSVKG
jgi:ABC-type glycerol-3-phosphate transport system permease component